MVESLWNFVIETLSLSVPFLCVGTAREPVIYLNRPHLSFGEVVVGMHRITDTHAHTYAECGPTFQNGKLLESFSLSDSII